MQVQRRRVFERDLPDDAHAEPLHALARRREVVGLEDRHVAGVPAAPVEPAAGGGVGLHRRDHLEEGVADREHHVLEPELGHARVPEGLAEPEDALQGQQRRLERARRESHLTEPHGSLPTIL